jgi:hypothetical protein
MSKRMLILSVLGLGVLPASVHAQWPGVGYGGSFGTTVNNAFVCDQEEGKVPSLVLSGSCSNEAGEAQYAIKGVDGELHAMTEIDGVPTPAPPELTTGGYRAFANVGLNDIMDVAPDRRAQYIDLYATIDGTLYTDTRSGLAAFAPSITVLFNYAFTPDGFVNRSASVKIWPVCIDQEGIIIPGAVNGCIEVTEVGTTVFQWDVQAILEMQITLPPDFFGAFPIYEAFVLGSTSELINLAGVTTPYTGIVRSDFSNTWNLSNIVFLDGDGNDVTGTSTWSMESGLLLTPGVLTAAPESKTMTLLGTGLILLAAAGRRRRAQGNTVAFMVRGTGLAGDPAEFGRLRVNGTNGTGPRTIASDAANTRVHSGV